MPNLTSFRRHQLRILHPIRVVFAMVPKAGNTSLRRAFHTALGAGSPNFKVTDDGFRIGKAIPTDAPIPADYMRIIMVRNPWSRFMSCYTNKVDGKSREYGGTKIRGELARIGCYRNMPFDEFTRLACATDDVAIDKHLAPVHYLIENPEWGGRPDLILRLERQPDDWVYLRHIFRSRGGFELPYDMPRANNTDYVPKPRWTRETINLVGDRYARDISLLGYEEPPC